MWKQRVGRPKFSIILTHGASATTAASQPNADQNGILREVIITTAAVVDSSATTTVNILDSDSNVIYTKTGVAVNTTSINLLTQDLSVPISGNITVQVVFSAAQTLADRTTTVVLLVDRG